LVGAKATRVTDGGNTRAGNPTPLGQTDYTWDAGFTH
jgi:hypothetical protein